MTRTLYSSPHPHGPRVHEDDQTRWLSFVDGAIQSRLDPGQPWQLSLPYTRSMMSVFLFIDDPGEMLMLGLGGGSVARFVHHQFPHTRMVALERSAEVVRVARRYFKLHELLGEKLQVVVGDARRLPLQGRDRWGLVVVDVFDANGFPPWLSNQELYRHCYRLLGPQGAMVANLWPRTDDEFLSVLAGIRSVFDNRVLVMGVPGHRNLIALGFKAKPEILDFPRLNRRAQSLRSRFNFDLSAEIEQMKQANLWDDLGLIL